MLTGKVWLKEELVVAYTGIEYVVHDTAESLVFL